MANTLYLSHVAEAAVRNLPEPRKEVVLDSLERLEQDPLGNSQPLPARYGDDDLRIARFPNDLQVVLRYVPEEQAVLVTSVDPDSRFELAA